MPDKAKPDDPAQSQRFIDMAREVDAAETNSKLFEESFERLFGVRTPKKTKATKD